MRHPPGTALQQNHMAPDADTGTRLRTAMRQAGGLAAVAQKSGISRAQLTRYLNGTPIPSDRLTELAPVLGVSPAWLLGDTAATRERFGSTLERTRALTEHLLQLLQRYHVEKAFLPSEISYTLKLMLASQHHAIEQRGEEKPFSNYDMENGLNFLNNIRKNDWLEVYVDGCTHYAEWGIEAMQSHWASKWAMIVQEAFKLHFTKEPLLTDYFVRLNIPIRDNHLRMMQNWVAFLLGQFPPHRKISVLDAGCGNGRHMIYLNQLGDRFDVRGIDSSPAALEFCRIHAVKGNLPKNSVTEGDFMSLPFEEDTFDAVMSIANLQFIPLVPDSLNIGLGRALYEMARVLKPGGYALLLIRSESADEFFPVFQCSHKPEDIMNLLATCGLKKVRCEPLRLKEIGLPGSHLGRGLEHQDIWVVQKDAPARLRPVAA